MSRGKTDAPSEAAGQMGCRCAVAAGGDRARIPCQSRDLVLWPRCCCAMHLVADAPERCLALTG